MAKTVCDWDFAHSAMPQTQNQDPKTAFEDTGKKPDLQVRSKLLRPIFFNGGLFHQAAEAGAI